MRQTTDEVEQARKLSVGVVGIRGLPASYSGIERAAESIYPRLAARGHHITVYSRPDFSSARLSTYQGVRLRRLPALRSKSLETVSHVAVSGAHSILAADYDVVVLHAIAPGLFLWGWKLAGVPVVVRIDGLDWKRAKWGGIGSRVLKIGEQMIARLADEIVVVSRSLQDYFVREYGRRPLYIPNAAEPITLDGFEPDWQVLRQFDLEPQQYFVYVGRLVPEKRLTDLVRAFDSVDSTLKLAIVGTSSYTDPYVAALKSMANRHVRFTDFQSGRPLETLIRCSACFVLPSELEGMPLSLLEAAERQVPAIVSQIDPHVEILGPVEGYDLFFEAHDVRSLAGSMRRFLGSQDYYRNLAATARESVRQRYSWEAGAVLTEEVLLRVARPPKQDRAAQVPLDNV